MAQRLIQLLVSESDDDTPAPVVTTRRRRPAWSRLVKLAGDDSELEESSESDCVIIDPPTKRKSKRIVIDDEHEEEAAPDEDEDAIPLSVLKRDPKRWKAFTQRMADEYKAFPEEVQQQRELLKSSRTVVRPFVPIPDVDNDPDWQDSVVCRRCYDGESANHCLLLCDNNCGRGYHTFCLRPSIQLPPPVQQWFCPVCIRTRAPAAAACIV
jgi:hypothetical protein